MKFLILPPRVSALRTRHYLAEAEEALPTNSVLDTTPLVTLDRHPSGAGYPGPATRQLQRACRKEALEDRGRG